MKCIHKKIVLSQLTAYLCPFCKSLTLGLHLLQRFEQINVDEFVDTAVIDHGSKLS